MFDVNKTETVKCQQETNNSSDSIESNRRKLYDKPMWADKNIVLKSLFERSVPTEFKALKSWLGLRIVTYMINHAKFKVVDTYDGKRTVAVDLAESRWTSQQTLSDIWGVSPSSVKMAEVELRKKIIVSHMQQDGWARHRFLGFNEVFMTWLKYGAEIPRLNKTTDKTTKKVNKTAWSRSVTIDGQDPLPPMVKNSTHEIISLRINQTRIDDDEQAMPNVPTPPPTPSPEKASSYLKSSKQSEGTKDQIFGLTDRLTIIGNKPYPEINEFWNEAIKEFGFKACDQLLKMEHKFRWSPECQKSILRSLSEISDPEAYAEKKIALEASQEAKRQDVWIRSDWQGYIYGIEKGTIPIKPASPIPDDLQESLNKALMQTNHNNKQDKPKDSKIMLSYLSSICPGAAKNIKPRMK